MDVEYTKLNIFFFLGPTPRDSLEMYTAIVGRSLIPPPFEFGPWVQTGNEIQQYFNASGFPEMTRALITRDIPTSCNVNSVHFFPHGSQIGHEKEILAENTACMKLGVPLTAYFNSFIATDYTSLYNEAKSLGYFVMHDNQVYTFAYKGTHLLINHEKANHIPFTYIA